jgi:radical SAM protein with 4Fe4S-binding SPASM domain
VKSTGHIERADDEWRRAAAARFERLSPHKEECGDCSFIPVCGGGCSMAAHTELGDMHQPSCHKSAMEAAVLSLAQRTAASFSPTGLAAV